MVLVDTSVWIEHFRKGQATLAGLLDGAAVLTHPLVIGEISCGQMQNRDEILRYFKALPQAQAASHNEVLQFVESRRLWGRDIGWVDMHLLASALLSNCHFWTLDKRLARAAVDVGALVPANA